MMIFHEFGKLKIDKEGTIYHNDVPFENENISKYFKKNIVKESESYYIKVGNNKALIEVEDFILWVESIDIDEKSSKLTLHLSNEKDIIIDKYIELFFKDDYLYYQDKNDKDLRAKFLRAPYNQLMSFLSQSDENYFIKIGELQIKILE